MNSRPSALILILGLACALSGIAAAQSPATPPPAIEPASALGTTFTYQGQLQQNGGLVNGACDFRFRLWDAASGGAAVGGPLDIPNVPVSGGRFTVLLDFGASAFSGAARWLDVAVGCPSGSAKTTLSPRQALTAAPYALFSRSTGALQGRAVSAGAPAAGQVLKWDGSQWAPAADNVGVAGATYTAGAGLTLNGTQFSVAVPLLLYGSSSASGIIAASNSASGGYGLTGFGYVGVYGQTGSGGTLGIAGSAAVWGDGRSGSTFGVAGTSTSGTGVYGNGNSYGVYGVSNTTGVRGSSANGMGMYGTSNSFVGVYGSAGAGKSTTYGVYGYSASTGGYGLYGQSASASSYGVYGRNDYGTGVAGSGDAKGVAGFTRGGIGVYGAAGTGYAGYFLGKTHVQGTLTASDKQFKIDHLLDPAHKYLRHASVESAEMKTIYDGVVTLDASGAAVVELPAWFEALNGDFRYQLTAIGAPDPNLYIAEEIRNHRFTIAGGTPGMRVSWQVTGVRHDPWAAQHPLQVEEEKPPQEQGTYLYPQGYGQPETLGLDYVKQQAAQQASAPVQAARGDRP